MARPAFSLAVGRVNTIGPITLAAMGPLVAFAAHTAKVRMPETGKIIGMTLNVGVKGGTHVDSSVDVLDDGVSLLAAVFDVDALTAGTPVDKEGTALAGGAASVAKDSVLSIVLAEAGGTAPTYSDATLQIDYVSLGD